MLMGKIRIHKGRPVWVPTVTERFNAMIRERFISFIKEPGSLTHDEMLFRDWLVGYVRTTNGIISKEVKEDCLQFLKEKRAKRNFERREAARREALAYRNV
jgi:hypothetical protein